MPRSKATKKPVEEALELPDATTNGSVVKEKAGTTDADAKVLTKGKPRAKKTSKKTAAENPEPDHDENSQQYKEEEENAEKVPKASKGRPPKNANEEPAPKSSGAVSSRAKKEKQPAAEKLEEPATSKGRAKRGKAAAVEESAPKETKARGRKRKDPSEDANAVVEEAEPPKQRTKKEQPPLIAPEPAQKGKENKAETQAKRPRVNKRLADSEIAEVLEEEELAQEPPKATNKRTKKAKAGENGVRAEPVPVGDSKTSELTEEATADAVPTKATNKRTKKSKETEPVLPSEPMQAAKPTKQRAKREVREEPEPATSKKRAQKATAKKENEELAEPAESKPVRGRKKAATATKSEAAEDDAVDGSKSMLVEPTGCGAGAVLKSLHNVLNFCFPASKTKKVEKAGEAKVNLDKADFALPAEKVFNFKISSWNVAGLRAWLKKDGLQSLALEEPDIFCLQETKCSNDQLPEELTHVPGYHPYWLCMPGGYAGVAIYSKIMPINVEYGIGNEEFDDVGRMITAEYEKFYLINVYVPNSGRKLVNLEARMRWEKLFHSYVQKLDALKAVVICGDMNVSHNEIDLENPKTNTKNAGFTKEERDKMTELLGLGFVDTFRHLYPDKKGAYTYWTYMSNARARNVGWRLDYCIVSERFVPRVVDHVIRKQLLGSDHCPITVFLNI
ncbi:recombination repair protein 1 isoform X1 [Drosophila pseudoobscura]|uniref:DNA-(apurinic or apyrimidinic site) endonuclease n=1 Tax=Drosophila pseudoobscura pseudoobscura TaxID=46245 RepID=A0A6I8V5D5_DROPS|nr:recombination repair protein 1 isoform X1 [Drosophila pseudoobscura]